MIQINVIGNKLNTEKGSYNSLYCIETRSYCKVNSIELINVASKYIQEDAKKKGITKLTYVINGGDHSHMTRQLVIDNFKKYLGTNWNKPIDPDEFIKITHISEELLNSIILDDYISTTRSGNIFVNPYVNGLTGEILADQND